MKIGNIAFCAMMLLVCFCLPVIAADALTAKDYPTALAGWKQELTQGIPTFIQCTKVAVALQKTDGRDGETGKAITNAVAQQKKTTAWLAGLHTLLSGDSNGLEVITNVEFPEYRDMPTLIILLNDHGYPLAANCFAILYATANRMPGLNNDISMQGAKAWDAIPTDQLAVVDKVIFNRLGSNRVALNNLLSYLKQSTRIRIRSHFKLFLSTYSFVPKDLDGVSLIEAWVADEPADDLRLLQGADMLRRGGFVLPAAKLYQIALKRVPEPLARDARRGYAQLLFTAKSNKIANVDEESYEKILVSTDASLVAEAMLAGGDFAGAAKEYCAILEDKNTPLAEKLACWSGLLDSAPERALKTAPALFDAVDKDTKEMPALRSQYTLWLTKALWRAVGRDIKSLKNPGFQLENKAGSELVSGYLLMDDVASASLLEDVPTGYAQAAKLMARIWDMDPLVLTRKNDDERVRKHWRYPVAIILTMGGETELATKVIFQQTKETVPPPPGGWRDPVYNTVIDKNPREYIYPQENEARKLLMLLTSTAEKCPEMRERCAEVCGQAAIRIAEKMKLISIDGSYEMNEIYSCLQQINDEYIRLIEPQGKPVEGEKVQIDDIKVYRGMKDALEVASTNEEITLRAYDIWNTCLQPGFIRAKSPELKESVFQLSVMLLDKYRALQRTPDKTALVAKKIADHISFSTRNENNEYSKRLLEKYPLPVAPVM